MKELRCKCGSTNTKFVTVNTPVERKYSTACITCGVLSQLVFRGIHSPPLNKEDYINVVARNFTERRENEYQTV
jgi:hypothetical protein